MSKRMAKRTPQKWFVATLCCEERSLAYVRIKAASREQAEEKAWHINDNVPVTDWETVYADQCVESVEADDRGKFGGYSRVVKEDNAQNGGQSHE